MPTYKNIRVKIGKKPSGKDTRKSRLQRVQVLASGKYKFVKNLTKSSGKSKTTKTKSKKTSKGGNKKMAKRVPHIPMALLGGALGSLTVQCPSGSSLMQNIIAGDIQTFGYNAREIFTGIDANGQFNKDFIKKGWLPIIIGSVLHIAATKLGINKVLYRAQQGFPIKLGL